MTTAKNNGITRASVIAHILDAENFLSEEERAVLNKMYASITAPRKKSEEPTKTQLINKNLSEKLVEAMRDYGQPVDTKWIMTHVNGIMTAQKAVAVVKAAGKSIVKFYEGRQALYRLA